VAKSCHARDYFIVKCVNAAGFVESCSSSETNGSRLQLNNCFIVKIQRANPVESPARPDFFPANRETIIERLASPVLNVSTKMTA
jgi:hypothetical protein